MVYKVKILLKNLLYKKIRFVTLVTKKSEKAKFEY